MRATRSKTKTAKRQTVLGENGRAYNKVWLSPESTRQDKVDKQQLLYCSSFVVVENPIPKSRERERERERNSSV